MIDQEELKARIERTERKITFYVLYEKDLLKGYTKEKLERLIDEQLDVLIELYKLKG
ncbi:MAG: diguanylate cyclase [Prevotella sp.]|jgi:hypothetical protein|nr:diguanylate cyclase [Prevotella sp.]